MHAHTDTTTIIPDTAELARLADMIDQDGMAAITEAIPQLVDRGLSAGVSPTVLFVLADPAEPEVARARAFGMLATSLAARPQAVADALPAAAVVA